MAPGATLARGRTSLTTADVDLNDRVAVAIEKDGAKVFVEGTVRFKGESNFAQGEWCGVELDQANGKNDGCVNNERYFTCPPNYGIFVRPQSLRLMSRQAASTKDQSTVGARPALAATATPEALPEALPALEAADPGLRQMAAEDPLPSSPLKRPLVGSPSGEPVAVAKMSVDMVDASSRGLLGFWQNFTSAEPSAWESSSAPPGSPENNGRGSSSSPLESLQRIGQSVVTAIANMPVIGEGHDSDMDSDVEQERLSPEQASLAAFRDAAKGAVEEGTRGLFKAVLQFHQELAYQSREIRVLQSTIEGLRKEIVAKQDTPDRGHSRLTAPRLSVSSGISYRSVRTSVLAAAEAAVCVKEPASQRRVLVASASGKNADLVNGCYRPTDEKIGSRTAFQKESNPDIWFCYDTKHQSWRVQRAARKGSERGWLCSSKTEAAAPAAVPNSEGVWKMWTGSDWDQMMPVSVTFIEEDAQSCGSLGSSSTLKSNLPGGAPLCELARGGCQQPLMQSITASSASADDGAAAAIAAVPPARQEPAPHVAAAAEPASQQEAAPAAEGDRRLVAPASRWRGGQSLPRTSPRPEPPSASDVSSARAFLARSYARYSH